MLRIVTSVLALTLSIGAFAQDTSKIMFYNLLQFPNQSPKRINELKTIVHEVKPDVFMVCELSSNEGSVTILTQALNTNGISYYQRASYFDDGAMNNMLYYNTRKYRLMGQDTIASEPRFATVYELLYKPALEQGDSIVNTFIIVHLKAGNSDAAERTTAARKIRWHIDQETNGENIFLAGDFNIYSPTEGAFTTFTEKGKHPLTDPIDQIGEWSNDDYYARVHTQSTRTTSFGGGSTGGMDDRFDWILTSQDLEKGDNQVQYVFGSYKAFGNDGQHFNTAINIGTNQAVSSEIADALHAMSDHLPVVMEVSYSYVNSVDEVTVQEPIIYSTNHSISITGVGANTIHSASLYDINGREIFKNENGKVSKMEVSLPQAPGIYLVKVETAGNVFVKKLIISYLP